MRHNEQFPLIPFSLYKEYAYYPQCNFYSIQNQSCKQKNVYGITRSSRVLYLNALNHIRVIFPLFLIFIGLFLSLLLLLNLFFITDESVVLDSFLKETLLSIYRRLLYHSRIIQEILVLVQVMLKFLFLILRFR